MIPRDHQAEEEFTRRTGLKRPDGGPALTVWEQAFEAWGRKKLRRRTQEAPQHPGPDLEETAR